MAKKKPRNPISMWSVTLLTGDWFFVFARAKQGAEEVVRKTHYYDMTRREFVTEYVPVTGQIEPERKIAVYEECVGNQTKTAAEWCEGESAGPFLSNTYE